ncbi:MAG: hypothetical protein PHZ09_11760 [Eubacteriales bacterium]|nr:hypothetical protein [Eubacteriales bacterium]
MSNPYRAPAAAVILRAVADYRELRTFLKTHSDPPATEKGP